jgi:hypothetical protein
MKDFLFVLVFIGVTVVSWGVYGPLNRNGVTGLHQTAGEDSHLLAFFYVGVAYFVIAVVVPIVALFMRGEKGRWTVPGTIWSLAAGCGGALGALGIVLAFTYHGSPVYVMPLVFGCAPVVNTFVTMFLSKTFKQAGPLFFAGLILVIAGAATVYVFKPSEVVNAAKAAKPAVDYITVAMCIALTAVSWGGYGPILHKGQMAMAGSRLRPFMCVGLAYFAIAVVVPLVLLGVPSIMEKSDMSGSLWSVGGGTAGALGALGIIMAFNFGGKPIYVMPLVFGGAPVVNSLVTILMAKEVGEVNPLFYGGLITVMAGAVTVLLFAPKAAPHGAPAAAHAVPVKAPA